MYYRHVNQHSFARREASAHKSLVSNTSSWTPHAVDIVNAEYSYGFSASRCCGCEMELSFIVDRAAVLEMLFWSDTDFTCILENNSVCTVIIKSCATIDRLESNYAGVVSKEGVDPPSVEYM